MLRASLLCLIAAATVYSTGCGEARRCAARAGGYTATFAFPDAGTPCVGVAAPFPVRGEDYGNGVGATCVFGPPTGNSDLCTTSIELHCSDGLDTCTETGTFDWSDDGRTGSGSVTTSCLAPDGTTACAGTYGVTLVYFAP